mmetsp:Transcript_24312/g.63497  ORF Transcript_24312/g.63497 Transcript_24312/m.63497 type:complete len:328 (-) Transcript_24312:307-1290(-)
MALAQRPAQLTALAHLPRERRLTSPTSGQQARRAPQLATGSATQGRRRHCLCWAAAAAQRIPEAAASVMEEPADAPEPQQDDLQGAARLLGWSRRAARRRLSGTCSPSRAGGCTRPSGRGPRRRSAPCGWRSLRRLGAPQRVPRSRRIPPRGQRPTAPFRGGRSWPTAPAGPPGGPPAQTTRRRRRWQSTREAPGRRRRGQPVALHTRTAAAAAAAGGRSRQRPGRGARRRRRCARHPRASRARSRRPTRTASRPSRPGPAFPCPSSCSSACASRGRSGSAGSSSRSGSGPLGGSSTGRTCRRSGSQTRWTATSRTKHPIPRSPRRA